ncbi:unnamed protein product [Caenorhabditis bovis]|uniref:Smr domain-containing protein n=1 Tax=Caenorhabditis bovis TaxID=2654633 RepID=A0A8S1ENV0_9PELO|nr:unnamed protein product [Caenorhabditis bovis]
MHRFSVHEQCFDLIAAHSDVKSCIAEGHQVFIITRGLTGSGKSHMAREFAELCDSAIIHDVAKYLNGRNNSREAIANCIPKLMKDVKNTAAKRVNKLLIVELESVDLLRYKSLIDQAIRNDYEVYVLEPETDWKRNAAECLRRSTRGYTMETMEARLIEIDEMTSKLSLPSLVNYKQVKVQNYRNPNSSTQNAAFQNSNQLNNSPPPPDDDSKTSNSILPLFSLKPLPAKTVMMRNVSIQVRFSDIVRYIADQDVETIGFIEIEDSVERPAPMPNHNVQGRYSQDENEELSLRGIGDTLIMRMCFTMFPSIPASYKMDQISNHPFDVVFNRFVQLADADVDDNALPALEYLQELLEFVTMESGYTEPLNVQEENRLARIKERARECEDNHIQRLIQLNDTSNDEMLARCMHEQEEERVRGINSCSQTELEILRYLKAHFLGLEEEVIENVFIKYDFDYSASVAFLNTVVQNGNVSLEIPKVTIKRSANRMEHAENRTAPMPKPIVCKSVESPRNNLGPVQAKVLEMRKDLESRSGSAVEYQKKAYYASSSTKAAIQFLASEKMKEVRSVTRKMDQMIREAHKDLTNLDLHYMSVEGAVAFVRDVVNNLASKRRIYVITGAGRNSSNGVGEIKAAVLDYLEKNTAVTYFLQNDGCVKVVKN